MATCWAAQRWKPPGGARILEANQSQERLPSGRDCGAEGRGPHSAEFVLGPGVPAPSPVPACGPRGLRAPANSLEGPSCALQKREPAGLLPDPGTRGRPRLALQPRLPPPPHPRAGPAPCALRPPSQPRVQPGGPFGLPRGAGHSQEENRRGHQTPSPGSPPRSPCKASEDVPRPLQPWALTLLCHLRRQVPRSLTVSPLGLLVASDRSGSLSKQGLCSMLEGQGRAPERLGGCRQTWEMTGAQGLETRPQEPPGHIRVIPAGCHRPPSTNLPTPSSLRHVQRMEKHQEPGPCRRGGDQGRGT